MSLRKPILKVTRECSKCGGDGVKEKRTPFKVFKVTHYYNSYLDCKKCKGTGRIDVKQNDPKFKKYYKIALEQQVDDLTTKYRNAKANAFDTGEELRKYCKELDKVVNK